MRYVLLIFPASYVVLCFVLSVYVPNAASVSGLSIFAWPFLRFSPAFINYRGYVVYLTFKNFFFLKRERTETPKMEYFPKIYLKSRAIQMVLMRVWHYLDEKIKIHLRRNLTIRRNTTI